MDFSHDDSSSPLSKLLNSDAIPSPASFWAGTGHSSTEGIRLNLSGTDDDLDIGNLLFCERDAEQGDQFECYSIENTLSVNDATFVSAADTQLTAADTRLTYDHVIAMSASANCSNSQSSASVAGSQIASGSSTNMLERLENLKDFSNDRLFSLYRSLLNGDLSSDAAFFIGPTEDAICRVARTLLLQAVKDTIRERESQTFSVYSGGNPETTVKNYSRKGKGKRRADDGSGAGNA